MAETSTLSLPPNYDETQMTTVMVDAEHLGLRMVLPLLTFGALILGFVLVSAVLDGLGMDRGQSGLLALGGAVAVAVGAASISDRLLKRLWPSRRVLLKDEQYLVLRRPGREDRVISVKDRINMLTWRFQVPRRGRVPKGHWCLGLQLLQDERLMTLYTFVSPKQAETVEDFEAFIQLVSSRKKQQKGSGERESLREAGQQRRLLKAENERWQDGVELAINDFLALWSEMKAYGKSMVS